MELCSAGFARLASGRLLLLLLMAVALLPPRCYSQVLRRTGTVSSVKAKAGPPSRPSHNWSRLPDVGGRSIGLRNEPPQEMRQLPGLKR